jgi:hypothetical protein
MSKLRPHIVKTPGQRLLCWLSERGLKEVLQALHGGRRPRRRR